jgi:hypothetical protein
MMNVFHEMSKVSMTCKCPQVMVIVCMNMVKVHLDIGNVSLYMIKAYLYMLKVLLYMANIPMTWYILSGHGKSLTNHAWENMCKPIDTCIMFCEFYIMSIETLPYHGGHLPCLGDIYHAQ